jgi:hypothetical protein
MDNPKTQVTLDTRHRMKTNKTKNTTQNHIKSNNSGTAKVEIVKNERDPPLFTSKQLIKF